jgi:DNA-binding MarR family transcriptional regulator
MLATLERSTHLIAMYLELALTRLSLTQAEAHVLAELSRGGPRSIGDLHREFGHKRSTLTSVIDRLEGRGFVRREINPSDRRSFVIHLTRSGRAAGRHVTRVLDELESELRRGVQERDVQGLDAVASALRVAVERTGGL